eukprot:1027300-Alexandrium_andersonii.AAC.1
MRIANTARSPSTHAMYALQKDSTGGSRKAAPDRPSPLQSFILCRAHQTMREFEALLNDPAA